MIPGMFKTKVTKMTKIGRILIWSVNFVEFWLEMSNLLSLLLFFELDFEVLPFDRQYIIGVNKLNRPRTIIIIGIKKVVVKIFQGR